MTFRNLPTLCTALVCLVPILAHAQDAASGAAPGVAAAASAPGEHRTGNPPSCRPVYPPAALKARAQGDTRVRLTVDATGKVTAADVLQSAGPTPEHQLLDQAAADALSHCPFKPGRDSSGQPVGTQVVVTYRWVLE